MRIISVETIISVGDYAKSAEWRETQEFLHDAVRSMTWPPGSQEFTINPTRHGNGVEPIKDSFVEKLVRAGWEREQYLDLIPQKRPGPIDAVLCRSSGPPFAVEWETGNIVSSHRAVGKLLRGLRRRLLVGGVLIVPSRALYHYLTDRVGNFSELEPYFEEWRLTSCESGVFEIIQVEHDAISEEIPCIPKMETGLRAAKKGGVQI